MVSMPSMPRKVTLAFGLLLLWSLAQRADAQPAVDRGSPVLHEYITPDADEDMDLSSTNPGGQMPAAVRTPSGMVVPPDIQSTPEPKRIYHTGEGASQPGFRPDKDTRRPNVERYDDPFSPTLTPFKRMFAYDAVADDYSLYVRDTHLSPMVVAGSPGDSDDRFFGDMMVQLRSAEPVRIPSVGPGARLIKLVTSPKTELSVWRDGAENWFVKAETSARVRLISELAIARDSFASEFSDVPWSALPPVPPQPVKHRAPYLRVAQEIGISREQMGPREVITKMVSYFRSFAPSDEPPGDEGDIYLELALSKKGVCRHRAFAFLVTALNTGIPSRLIHNEAHAWVEVSDGKLWHRVDLGGAALDLAEDPNLERPPHNPPPDQFPWPAGRDSGADLAHRQRQEALEQRANDPAAQAADPSGPGVSDPNAPPRPGRSRELPETTITVDSIDHDIFRGLPVRIAGSARSAGQPCSHLRVDVVLLIAAQPERRLGSLSTDERGLYDGAVVMPPDVPIGDHQLVVTTGGDARCGPGDAR